MPSLEDRIRLLEDKEAIRELTARYCYAIADGDADALVGLFTHDGSFASERGEWVGVAALRQFYRRSAGRAVTNKPFVQNHVIEVDGDQARCRCAAEVRIVDEGGAVTAAGFYADRLQRVDGRWRFARRRYTAYHRVPLSRGWA